MRTDISEAKGSADRQITAIGFDIPGGPGTSPPRIPRDNCIDGIPQTILIFI